MQFSPIDHQGDPAQRDRLASRLVQGTRANRANRHLPGNSFESFKKWTNGQNSEDGVTEKPERKMHNQGDRSKSVGQVQTDSVSGDTEEVDGLPVVEHDGATEVWKSQTAFAHCKEQSASCKWPTKQESRTCRRSWRKWT